MHELIIREYNIQRERILKKIKEGFPTLSFLSYHGWYTDAVKVNDLLVAEEKIIEIKENSATIVISVVIYFEIMVYYKENESYKLEKDSHLMEIEIVFKFGRKSFGNDFDYINIESIKPKTNEDAIVMINEEEFGMI